MTDHSPTAQELGDRARALKSAALEALDAYGEARDAWQAAAEAAIVASNGLDLPIAWADSDLPVLAASVFAVQADENCESCWFTVGQIAPPIFGGAEQDQISEIKRLGTVAATPVGRYTVTWTEVRKLRDLLDRFLLRWSPS